MSTEKKKTGLVKGMNRELKKVVWPKKDEIIKSTLVVVSALIAVSIITKLLDLLFNFILSFTI